MKKEITHLDVRSVALMYGAILASIGLVIAVFILIFGSLFISMMDADTTMFMGGGVVAAIFIPFLYGMVGLIIGAIVSALYNFIASQVGGVKVTIRD
jgi:hypothetical protein